MLTRTVPVLHVSRSVDAARFYGDRLGFEVASVYRPFEGRADPGYLVVARDGATLHLSSFAGDGVAGGAVNLYAADLDALYRELVAAGVAGAMPPTDQSWGAREVTVEDPDGNSLRFVQDARGGPVRTTARLPNA